MCDRWHVVKVEGLWGTEYYIQDKTTGHTLRALDGVTAFTTTSRQLADSACRQANKEESNGRH